MNTLREEKRLAYRLIAHWKKLQKGKGLPDIRQFSPAAIGDMWQHCIRLLVTENNNVRLYKYEHIGPNIVAALGKDLTGHQVTPSIRTVPGANIIRKLDLSIPLHEPVMEQGQFINHNDKIIKYRSCILPFGDINYALSHAVIGLSWKVVGD